MKNTFYSQGNPYNIVRTTSATYTASVGELIIADETEITLPSGVPAGSVIAVRSSSDTVTTDVVGASGSIDGFSAGTTHQEAKTGEYVYDGSDWYLRNSVDIRDGAIPDSVVIQHTATTWAQGDSTWGDDDTEDGSQDVSLTGDFQSDTLSDESESILGDGVDDYGDLTLPAEFEGSSLNSFTIEFAIRHSDSDSPVNIIGTRNDDGTQNIEVNLNVDNGFNTDTGNVRLVLTDDAGDTIVVEPSTNPNLDDSSRHDVTIIVNDASASDVDMIIDGSSLDLNFGTSQNPSSFTTWDRPVALWGWNDGGSISRYWNGEIAADRWHDQAISSQTIDELP